MLLDAQLPPALVQRLSALGRDAAHVNDIGLGGAGDREIWRHAANTGSVIVSKDQDFADLAIRDPSGPQVIWIRLGNTSTDALWRSLEPLLPQISEALAAGERLVEIL